MTKILMAMSGGIDSAVAAMLLLKQGYKLVGCTFRTYDNANDPYNIQSIKDAKNLADKLGFEHHVIDFRNDFKNIVIRNFISEYKNGRTPNPCILCNKYIKFGLMFDIADQYNCDYIATGHYARITNKNGHYYLQKAADIKKDQTYFLWELSHNDLSRIIFPLGNLTKDDVRNIAKENGFVKLSEKKESQDICFIANNDYRAFLKNNGINSVPGYFLYNGEKLNVMHTGYTNYTIGQRKNLGISIGKPAYVTNINIADNTIAIGSHDDLYTDTINIRNLNLRMNIDNVKAQIRYHSQMVNVISITSSSITFDTPVWGVTPGQSCVLYHDDLIIGGCIIN